MIEKAFTVWFTGISRSGKSTLASMLCERLSEQESPGRRFRKPALWEHRKIIEKH